MIRTVTVSEVMTPQPVTTAPESGLNAAVELMLHHRVSGLPVVGAGGDLVGILTEQDCLRAAYRSGYYQNVERTVAEVMTTEVTSIETDADVMTAIDLFLHNPFRRLPVVNRRGQLVGLISRRDALRALKASR